MKKSVLYAKALTNIAIYLISIVLIVVFVPKLLSFFLPFVIGLIVSAIANPAAKFFEEKIKFKRKAASAFLIVLIIALIILAGYGIITFLVTQGIGLAQSIPEKWGDWQTSLDRFGREFNSLIRYLPLDVRNSFNNFGTSLRNAVSNFISGLGSSNVTEKIIGSISAGLGNIAGFIIAAIMSVLSSYFFTVEHNFMINSVKKVLPETAYSKCMAAYRGLKNAVGGYFKAQLQIELWVYLVTMIGLLIIRIDYAVIIALLIAILDLLPFFGAGIVMIPWGIVAITDGNYFVAIGMFITWGVGQLVRQLIQPKIVGDKVGIAPLPTLVLLYVGYKLMGVFGMVIILPIAMIFISLYKEGLFVNLIRSIRILWEGISEFRKLPPLSKIKESNSENNEEDKNE